MSKYKEQVTEIDMELDFDMMMELAKENPDEFEEIRQELINDYLQSLPEERRHRMECLQWRIDRARDKAKTPLASCIAITDMMWESFEQLNTLFMEMKDSESRVKVNVTLQSADILPFKTA